MQFHKSPIQLSSYISSHTHPQVLFI